MSSEKDKNGAREALQKSSPAIVDLWEKPMAKMIEIMRWKVEIEEESRQRLAKLSEHISRINL